MPEMRRFGLADLLLLLLVLATAGLTRAGYLWSCTDGGRNQGPLRVQDSPPPLRGLPPDTVLRNQEDPNEFDALVHNLEHHQWFGSLAPFAPAEEKTAHVAPGYPWLVAALARVLPANRLDSAVRWTQCGLGALTAGLCFLFARRAFRCIAIATLTGLLAAVHPFWVIDTAALNDGVLATFLLSLSLFLALAAAQTSGPFASLLYGLTLAGLSLVRAALLPFAFLALAWFLLRSRTLSRGWLCALVAFLGFVIGLAPWTIRNLQVFGEPVPIVDSAYLHLWIGNNPQATGGPLTDDMRRTAPAEELRKVPEQPARYARLGPLVWKEMRDHPAQTLQRRLRAGFDFLVGADWFQDGRLAQTTGSSSMPSWLAISYPVALQATLLVLLGLGLFGWRLTYAWRAETMPLTLALVWVPLPYILSHAGALSGARLPLDAVLLCYVAFVVVSLFPAGRGLLHGPPPSDAADEPR